MAQFVIYFEGTDGREYSECYVADSISAARHAFTDEYTDPIIRVENASIEQLSYQVAHNLLSLLKKSTNPNERVIGMLSKPISAISVNLIQEFNHYLQHEKNNNATTIAKKIYNLLIE